MFIDTPDGTIELHYQARYEVGHSQTNIETLVFSDVTLDDAAIRQRALDDQNTAGDDSVEGTLQSDVIAGGVGNDTLNGNGGADTFVFEPGDGADVISDFEDGIDIIRFVGVPGSFSGLSITDEGSDAVVTYDGMDSVRLTSISSTQITEDDFEFA